MKRILKLASLISLGLVLIVSCKKETPLPTVSFTAKVESNVVTLSADVTNVTKYEWDFGDGSYINTLHAPVHVYGEYGRDFTITLTVIGPGGRVTVSNKVTIPPKTKLQLLAGGTGASSSKKWRLSKTATSLTIAYANSNLTIIGSYPGSILGDIQMSMAYSDEFIFNGDGTMSIDPKGGGMMSSLAYCMGNKIPMSANYAAAGLAYMASFTPPVGATFAINEGKDYTITTPVGAVTYSNSTTLSFTNGGFLGMKDFSSECIVRKLTDTQLDVVIFYAHPSYGAQPMLAFIVTFEVAP